MTMQTTASVAKPLRVRGRSAVPTLMLALACAGLAAYLGTRVIGAATAIHPSYAYLATEVAQVASPSTGRLVFASDQPTLSAGEPLFGVETANGKTVFVDAQADYRLVSQEAVLGTRVRRGQTVLSVAQPIPDLLVHALVSRQQAERLLQGGEVEFVVLGDGATQPVRLSLAAGQLQFRARAIAESGQPAVYEVSFAVPDAGVVYRHAPLELTFRMSLTGQVKHLLSGLGVPQGAAAALLVPLAWLSGLTGREV